MNSVIDRPQFDFIACGECFKCVMTQGPKKTSIFRPWTASTGDAPILSRLEGMVGAIDDREVTTPSVESEASSSLTDSFLAQAQAQAQVHAAFMLGSYGLQDTSLFLLEQEHLQLEAQNSQSQQRKQRPKKYRCPHCQVAFSNNGQLRGHVRIHTGERPFECDAEQCGKRFTRNEELTRHKRIHSGVRPFACSTCGKRFGRKDHLKKHSRTHEPSHKMAAAFLPAAMALLPHPYPYLYGF